MVIANRFYLQKGKFKCKIVRLNGMLINVYLVNCNIYFKTVHRRMNTTFHLKSKEAIKALLIIIMKFRFFVY